MKHMALMTVLPFIRGGRGDERTADVASFRSVRAAAADARITECNA